MSDKEFLKFLFPPAPLSFKRKLVINLIMLAITIGVAWLSNSPSSSFYMGAFQ